MKTKKESIFFAEEISSSECETVIGGTVPVQLAVAGIVTGILIGACGLAYYVGYQVGKLTAETK